MSIDKPPRTDLEPGARAVARNTGPRALLVRVAPWGIGVLALVLTRGRRVGLIIALIAFAVGVGGWIQRSLHRAETEPETDTDPLKVQKRALSRSQYLENIDTRLAEKAFAQFEQNEDRFKKFRAILSEKFESSELTYGRYFSAADQVHAAVLQNLQDVTAMLNNLDSLDVRGTRRELKQLEQRPQPTADDQRVLGGLRERLEIAERTEAEVRSRLAYNEEALTELDRVNLALASIKTSKSASSVDLETAMHELRELADRAKKYST